MSLTLYELRDPELGVLDASGDARLVCARSDTLPAERSGPAKLLYVTASKDENDWNSTMHDHRFLELFYVLSGTGRFLIGRESYPVSPSDLVIVNPHVEHTEKSGSQPLEYVALGIEGLRFDFTESENQCSIANYAAIKNDLQVLFGMLVRELQSERPNKAEVCQSILNILLIQIVRTSRSAPRVTASQNISSSIETVRQYIDVNFKLPLTLDILSEQCHLSKFYLVHHFTETFGVSPISYLLQRRMDESRLLLRTTDHSLTRISQVVGFSSPSYFSQSFRRIEGMSPKEYRLSRRSDGGLRS